MFVLFLRGSRADFKARAILVLRLRTANLLKGAALKWTPLRSPFSPYCFGLCEPRATKAGKVGLLLSFM